jgi:hypothetical protein
MFDPPPPIGLTPAVSERPVPIEPKVVIASKANDDGQEIDLSIDPPSSKGGGFMPSFGAAAPAPIPPAKAPAKATPERPRADTPAANPVMSPAPLALPAPAPAPSILEPATDLAPARKPRQARAIVAAVAAVCLVIGGIAGYRAWQKQASTSAATDTPVEPPPTATPAPPRPIATPAEPTAPPVTAPRPAPVESPAPPPQPKTAPPIDREPDEDDRNRASPGSAPRGPRPPSVETPPAAPPPPPPPRPKFDPKRI